MTSLSIDHTPLSPTFSLSLTYHSHISILLYLQHKQPFVSLTGVITMGVIFLNSYRWGLYPPSRRIVFPFDPRESVVVVLCTSLLPSLSLQGALGAVLYTLSQRGNSLPLSSTRGAVFQFLRPISLLFIYSSLALAGL